MSSRLFQRLRERHGFCYSVQTSMVTLADTGSIHVYGTLRGRAMAGSTGNASARIFCRKIEAELVAIDGLYRTADDIDEHLRRRAVQVWLEGDVMRIAALD